MCVCSSFKPCLAHPTDAESIFVHAKINFPHVVTVTGAVVKPSLFSHLWQCSGDGNSIHEYFTQKEVDAYFCNQIHKV